MIEDDQIRYEDWSIVTMIVILIVLIGFLFWWPLILYSWHYWVG